ncbi:MAG: ABC transporter permease [Bdellovibrionota bacterium]
MKTGVWKVWRRNFLVFRKTWLVSLFWVVIEPLMYLGAIGYGLGSFVNQVEGKPYVLFFFPALLCTTSMMVPFFEGTYAVYTKLTYQKIYATLLLTPLRVREILHGELLWSASKGFFGVLGVSLIASLFGLVGGWTFPLVFVVLFLNSFVFACIAMVFVSYAKNYDSFIFSTSGFIVPMSLIAGTYFPLESLPTVIQNLAYILPLTHTVSAVRMILDENWDWMLGVNIIYLLLAALFFSRWAISRLERKLIN